MVQVLVVAHNPLLPLRGDLLQGGLEHAGFLHKLVQRVIDFISLLLFRKCKEKTLIAAILLYSELNSDLDNVNESSDKLPNARQLISALVQLRDLINGHDLEHLC